MLTRRSKKNVGERKSEQPSGRIRQKGLLSTLRDDEKDSGLERVTRPRSTVNRVARRCCACQAAALCGNTELQRPHKPSADVSKSAIKRAISSKRNNASRSKPSAATGLSGTKRERNSVQISGNPRRTRSIATSRAVSENSSPEGTSVVKKKLRGVKEMQQSYKTPPLLKTNAGPSNKTVAKTIASHRVWRKKVQTHASDGNKTATTKPDASDGNKTATTKPEPSKQPPRKIRSSLKVTEKLKKKPAVLELGHRKETKAQSSHGQRVWKRKDSLKASNNQSIPPADADASAGMLGLPSEEDLSGEEDLSSEDGDLHHITCDDADADADAESVIGEICCLCESDLSVVVWEVDEQEAEFSHLPVAAILSCGHAFHAHCLGTADLEGQEGDPPCIFCLSINNC